MPSLEAALIPSSLHVNSLEVSERVVTVHAKLAAAAADCPQCGQPSAHTRSTYVRTLGDLPWGTWAVRLRVTVRRFRCTNPACPRRIFAEALGALAPRYARRTGRLARALEAVAFALGGEAGARLAADLGLPTSPDTLLRLIRRAPEPTPRAVAVCGVDDFAWRKRRRYGTALVDLERHQLIDLLPERSAAGVAVWLRRHPEITVVSRDRGGAYADGARLGAPQATQVADRFHLLRNLGDVTRRVLLRHADLVRRVRSPDGTPSLARLRPDRAASRERTRVQMAACFAAIHAAAARGLSKSAIARALGVHRHTVQKYLALDAAPERRHANRTTSILAPYEAYLLERWHQGCHDARALWREIAALGYPGSYGPVVRALRQLRLADAAGEPVAPPDDGLTPPQAVGLLLTRPAARQPGQRAAIAQLRALHPDLQTTIGCFERFAALVRSRDAPDQEAQLERWLEDATGSGVQELAAFATKLRQDLAAVRAGLTLPWSQGQTEGQILKLKLLRRQMYGRGSFDLVRKRALRAA
jgi:transposase